MANNGQASTDTPTQDLRNFPDFSFSEVERYAKTMSGCTSTTRAYKFFAEPGYLHNIQAMIYANQAKSGMVNLYPSGLVICPKSPWLGCSPDRKVYDITAAAEGSQPFGLLEIKVVKEGETDFKNVRYVDIGPLTSEKTLKNNHDYYFQVQCQLAITGIEWCDFFSYMNDNTCFCQRILFDKDFFRESKDKVDKFFFQYFLQAT